MHPRFILKVSEFLKLQDSKLDTLRGQLLNALSMAGAVQLWTDEVYVRTLSPSELTDLQATIKNARRTDCAFCRSALTEPHQVQFCCPNCQDEATWAECHICLERVPPGLTRCEQHVNTVPTFGMLCERYCAERLPLQVLQSAAGYYLGCQSAKGEPMSRESVEYYGTRTGAQHALDHGTFTQRTSP